MKTKSKTIGILGGMGPQASAYLYKLLIDISVSDFGARHNDEYPEVILYSVPVPDFISDNQKRNEARDMLKDRTNKLSLAGAKQAGIACNTAHVLLSELKHSKLTFVSMIDEVVSEVKEKQVGLMATPSTIYSGMYQIKFEERGVETLLPSNREIKILERIIRRVLSGKILKKDTHLLKTVADNLVSRGAQAIILGCTELPLMFLGRYKVPVYNSSEVLARALLRNYYN